MLSDTQIREVFHFCFLQRLLQLSDPNIYILKGGMNLRFFEYGTESAWQALQALVLETLDANA